MNAYFANVSTKERVLENIHEFVPGPSYMTQMIRTVEIWSEILDRDFPRDVIYLDFRKAFDMVPHQKLLTKLEADGIKVRTLGWIKNFLLGRKQRDVVNGQMSTLANILSGIPHQCPGPNLVRYIFINDLPDVVTSTVKI